MKAALGLPKPPASGASWETLVGAAGLPALLFEESFGIERTRRQCRDREDRRCDQGRDDSSLHGFSPISTLLGAAQTWVCAASTRGYLIDFGLSLHPNDPQDHRLWRGSNFVRCSPIFPLGDQSLQESWCCFAKIPQQAAACDMRTNAAPGRAKIRSPTPSIAL